MFDNTILCASGKCENNNNYFVSLEQVMSVGYTPLNKDDYNY